METYTARVPLDVAVAEGYQPKIDSPVWRGITPMYFVDLYPSMGTVLLSHVPTEALKSKNLLADDATEVDCMSDCYVERPAILPTQMLRELLAAYHAQYDNDYTPIERLIERLKMVRHNQVA